MQKRGGVLLFVVAVCFLYTYAASAQMLDPAMDRDGEPFSYFSKPTDVIGQMDARAGTLVSPEGYFYTGFGELMLFTGDPPVPIQQRIKTLYQGYLPIVQYTYSDRGIDYNVVAFAATDTAFTRPCRELQNYTSVMDSVCFRQV